MRIVVDMQGAQGVNKDRGLGRYTLSFAQALCRNSGKHEVLLALNDRFPDAVEKIRNDFEGLIPRENIRVWQSPTGVSYAGGNAWLRRAAEHIREAFLASLKPDIIHVGSLFEGFTDDVVTDIGSLQTRVPVAVTLYDLIPYIHPSIYLENQLRSEWYSEKVKVLRQADLWLAISESSRQEGIKELGLGEVSVVNCSGDADNFFGRVESSSAEERLIRDRYQLDGKFIMYTGGIDRRKNIESLIIGYGRISPALRMTHQLVIVCSIDDISRRRFEALINESGLQKRDVTFTGYVPDEELRALYNMCDLFVFPSWHEGFGLPALEAMRCGAPVIGANATSLPEIIGSPEAMFDPHDISAISAAIETALQDPELRARIIKNGANQEKKFSWDSTALRALEAMESSLRGPTQAVIKNIASDTGKPKLAVVSPIPPERTGIAHYSAELIPHLADYYDIDAITPDPALNAGHTELINVKSTAWFADNIGTYDRVLYHFGNSSYHSHMFELLEKAPGVVVLHDFYLSGVLAHIDHSNDGPRTWLSELYDSHGYGALFALSTAENPSDIIWKYPCNLRVLQNSLGVVSHSAFSFNLAQAFYQDHIDAWEVIPMLQNYRSEIERESARNRLGIGEGDIVVAAFGMMGPTKLNARLIDAWQQSFLSESDSYQLIFVGEPDNSPYCREVQERSQGCNIAITGWTDREQFTDYLLATDIAVQLRTLSRGETSAALLECMNFGIPTIVNRNGAMADIDPETAFLIDDDFTDDELTNALEQLASSNTMRQRFSTKSRQKIKAAHDPSLCARLYFQAIEKFYENEKFGPRELVRQISTLGEELKSERDVATVATAIAQNTAPSIVQKTIFVDISEFVIRDAKSGIQRVVANILYNWLRDESRRIRIEPVYATEDSPYRYARNFISNKFDLPNAELQDEIIECNQGDIFLVLDLCPAVQIAKREYFKELRAIGVAVTFLVYDLLAVRCPQYFLAGAEKLFTSWLEVVAEADTAICISKAVATDLQDWLSEERALGQKSPHISWFHLAGELNARDLKGNSLRPYKDQVSRSVLSKPTFLMVGTLEPRKGHEQVLSAFEVLWEAGLDINLLIAGKQGWMVEELVARIDNHEEAGNRLKYWEQPSDEDLRVIYESATCLIMASYGEGFGLPILEAANQGLPLILRDIPIFREIAGDHAFYFDAASSAELSSDITSWLRLYRQNKEPQSSLIESQTWAECAKNLINLVRESL